MSPLPHSLDCIPNNKECQCLLLELISPTSLPPTLQKTVPRTLLRKNFPAVDCAVIQVAKRLHKPVDFAAHTAEVRAASTLAAPNVLKRGATVLDMEEGSVAVSLGAPKELKWEGFVWPTEVGGVARSQDARSLPRRGIIVFPMAGLGGVGCRGVKSLMPVEGYVFVMVKIFFCFCFCFCFVLFFFFSLLIFFPFRRRSKVPRKGLPQVRQGRRFLCGPWKKYFILPAHNGGIMVLSCFPLVFLIPHF